MAKRKRKHLITCPYCFRQLQHCNSQADHIPPKCLFPVSQRKNLMTVSCCPKCHEELSTGDDALKAMVAFGVKRNETAGHLLPSVKRSLRFNSWWSRMLVEATNAAKPVCINAETNKVEMIALQLGGDYHLHVNTTIKRCTVGILFLHHPNYRCHDFSMSVFQPMELNLENIEQEWREEIGKFNFRKNIGDGAYEVSWEFAEGTTGAGMMIHKFAGGLAFYVFFGPMAVVEQMLDRAKKRN